MRFDPLGFCTDNREVWRVISPTSEGLARLILRARRCNVWYRRLSCCERRYLEAVTQVVDKLQSPLLLSVVGRIVRRLLDTVKGLAGDIRHMMLMVGKSLAQGLSRIAEGWGYKAAVRWAEDQGFIKYLTIMYLNKPTISQP